MTSIVGLEEDNAVKILESDGFNVIRREYVSKRGIDNADSTRVIRQRLINNKDIEITISYFRTKIK